MVKHVVLALALAACQGSRDEALPASESPPRDAEPVAVVPGDADVAVVPGDADVAGGEPDPSGMQAKPEEPETAEATTATALIAQLDAVPAWQAVVDRGQYLARRNQRGVVYGTLGEPILVLSPTPDPVPDAGASTRALDAGLVASDYSWLVDDTEGNGALGIRVMLGARGGSVAPGDRVALHGAWVLDASRSYYWKADEVIKLPALAAGEPKDPPAQPGHVIETVERIPAGARTISVARDNDLVYFTVVGKPPAADGDGWAIANELGDPIVALLNLPGERASFGGQDFRTPSERWQLRRGWRYALRIGKIRRPRGPDKPALINARTAPVRIK
jgi:hypothetical protein